MPSHNRSDEKPFYERLPSLKSDLREVKHTSFHNYASRLNRLVNSIKTSLKGLQGNLRYQELVINGRLKIKEIKSTQIAKSFCPIIILEYTTFGTHKSSLKIIL